MSGVSSRTSILNPKVNSLLLSQIRQQSQGNDIHEVYCSFLPTQVLKYFEETQDGELNRPDSVAVARLMNACVLHVDMLGFTLLCEELGKNNSGIEGEYNHYSAYLEQIMKAIFNHGGDLISAFGETFVIAWFVDPDDLAAVDLVTATRRATQVAFDLKAVMADAILEGGGRINVKAGVGSGAVSLAYLGGVGGHVDYVCFGEAVSKASEFAQLGSSHASKEVVLSPDVFKLVFSFFDATLQPSGCAFVTNCTDPLKAAKRASTRENLLRGKKSVSSQAAFSAKIKPLVPAPLLRLENLEELMWMGEVRHVTLLVVHFGITERNLEQEGEVALGWAHTALRKVQEQVRALEGTVLRLVVDAAGTHVVAAFGLAPLTHSNDSLRAVLAGLCVVDKMRALALRPSVAIATGAAYCGAVGVRARREYVVLGETMALCLRLVKLCNVGGVGVVCNAACMRQATAQMGYSHRYLRFYCLSKGDAEELGVWLPISVQRELAGIGKLVANLLCAEDRSQHEGGESEEDEAEDKVVVDDNLPKEGILADKDVDNELEQQLMFAVTNLIGAMTGRCGSSKNGCVIVEADAGMGKTACLALAFPVFRSQHPNVDIVFAAADPLYHEKEEEGRQEGYSTVVAAQVLSGVDGSPSYNRRPLSTWAFVLNRLITRKAKGESYDNGATGCVRAFIRHELKKSPRKDCLAALNEPWPTLHLEENEASMSLSRADRLQLAQHFLLALVKKLADDSVAAGWSIVICIEDCQHLDPLSWLMCHQVSKIPGLLLVLACRPMYTVNISPFAHATPDGYLRLIEEPKTAVVGLEPRSPEVMVDIACKQLSKGSHGIQIGPQDVPGPLIDILLYICGGNPLFAHELIRHLKDEGLLQVGLEETEDNGFHNTVQMDSSVLFDFKDDRYTKVVPPSAFLLFGSLIDRLTITEQMVLRSAAVIGSHFSLSAVLKGLPISGIKSESHEGSALAEHSEETIDVVRKALSKMMDLDLVEDAVWLLADNVNDEEDDDDYDNPSSNFAPRATLKDVASAAAAAAAVGALNHANARVSAVASTAPPSSSEGDPASNNSNSNLEISVSLSVGNDPGGNRRSSLSSNSRTPNTSRGNSGKGVFVGAQKTAHSRTQNSGSGSGSDRVRRASELPAGAEGAKQRMGKLTAPDPCFRFRHALLRASVLERMLLTQRQEISQKLGDLVEKYKLDVVNMDALTNEDDEDYDTKCIKESALEGFLFKAGDSSLSRFKERYFILFNDKMLFFQDKSMHPTKGHSKGVITLDKGFSVEEKNAAYNAKNMRLFHFWLFTGGKNWKLACRTKEKKDKWVKVLRRISSGMKEAETEPTMSISSQISAMGALSANSLTRTRDTKRISVSTMANFIQGGDSNSPSKKRRSGTVPPNMTAKFNESIREGFLSKKGGSLGKWQLRYFVLFEGKLLYYKAREDNTVAGMVDIASDTVCHTEPDGKNKFTFSVTSQLGARKYMIMAKDGTELKTWMDDINNAIKKSADSAKKQKSKMASRSVMEGHLQKLGGKIKGTWQRRYFVLFERKLQHFESDKDNKLKLSGELQLFSDTSAALENTLSTCVNFFIVSKEGGKKYSLIAKDQADAQAWVKAINSCCLPQINSKQYHDADG